MNSIVKAIVKNEEGREQFGKFQFEWDATGNREGDYFISWSWITEDQVFLADHQMFRLESVKKNNTYMPVRYTAENKYETLLDRYSPNLYKQKITNTDLTPSVIGRLQGCVAKGFTQIENMANQLMDIYDANTMQEAIMPLVANMFNLNLKSNDPALWRRQIKQAIPLYKRKGTGGGLAEALDQAGIKLTKITKLWQIVSEYTWIDSFLKSDDTAVVGTLSKIPIDLDAIEVTIKAHDNDELLPIPKECIKFDKTDDGVTVLWFGEILETPISLYQGDLVLIKYNIKTISAENQTLETYIQSLPLADHRACTKHRYPLKNWNVHLIEEDDPLLDVIVKSRHPYNDNVVYGKIRTKFLYSEKVYNMDTYNGSMRDSKNPCDIDKNFLDTCSCCRSSKFNIDIEIEELSNERISEAKEIITEYTPFHSILNVVNIAGGVNEFVISPIETIETLVNVVNKDTIGSQNVKDVLPNQEEISYEIEWADGSKEKYQRVGV